MSDPAETLREPDGGGLEIAPPPTPEPTASVVRTSYRAAALALAVALIAVAGLVAAAPWWTPLVPWGPQSAREAALSRRLDRLDAAAATLDRLERRVGALEARQRAAPPDLAALRQQIDDERQAAGRLAQRVATIENAKAAAGDALERRVAALEGASKDRADAASNLDKRLATLAAQVHGAASEAADAGLAVALLRISEAVADGRPFGSEFRTFRILARGRAALEQAAAPLADAAAAGVASRAALARELPALAAKLAAAPPAEPATGGWAAQAWRGLRGLVRVRRVDAPPRGPEAIVAAAGKALAAGDLSGAIDRVASFEGVASEAAAGWLREARRRLAAEQAVRRLETALTAPSGKTEPGPAKAGGGGAPG